MNNKRIEEEFKPRTWLLIVLIIIGLGITVVLVDKAIEEKKKKDAEVQDKIKNVSDDFFGNFKEMYDNAREEYDEHDKDFDKESFNNDYELYSGTKHRIFVITLIDKVITNNKTNSDHLITVKNGEIESSDPEEIRKIKDNITDITKEYEVILDYDEEGYVNSITIEE